MEQTSPMMVEGRKMSTQIKAVIDVVEEALMKTKESTTNVYSFPIIIEYTLKNGVLAEVEKSYKKIGWTTFSCVQEAHNKYTVILVG